MKIRLALLAALSFTLATAGCGMLSGSKPAAAPIDPSTGAVVVLYHVHLGANDDGFTDHNVYVNGAKIGRLNAGEELRVPVGPGVTELSIQPQMRWLGTAQQTTLKYSVETAKQGSTTRYLRYRTANGQGRITPSSSNVLPDRDLAPTSESEYAGKN